MATVSEQMQETLERARKCRNAWDAAKLHAEINVRLHQGRQGSRRSSTGWIRWGLREARADLVRRFHLPHGKQRG
jgi:hypothetical protein